MSDEARTILVPYPDKCMYCGAGIPAPPGWMVKQNPGQVFSVVCQQCYLRPAKDLAELLVKSQAEKIAKVFFEEDLMSVMNYDEVVARIRSILSESV